jgi:hypothetical protein
MLVVRLYLTISRPPSTDDSLTQFMLDQTEGRLLATLCSIYQALALFKDRRKGRAYSKDLTL